MSINDIFVGQQVCKQAHTHAELYRTHATVLQLLRFIFVTKPVPDCRRSCSFNDKLLLNFTSAFCDVNNYRYYRGKTNSYHGDHFTGISQKKKISPNPNFDFSLQRL